ncbi:MAG: hypothetical protein J7K96_04395 [Desulfobacteraceae bacterium]|nr:hypothetical protein [Desulfobacteraceae bacterium]
MKPTHLYQHLKELAVKLDISVAEQNMRVTGINAKSGLCIVKDQKIFIMDKHLTVREKVQTLADCLRSLPLDNIYVMPAIRKYLDRS